MFEPRHALRLTILACTLVALASPPLAPASLEQSTPTLEQVLERARAYVEDYQQKAALILCDERSVQKSWAALRADIDPMRKATTVRRVLESEFLLVWVATAGRWMGFRDVTNVDGKPIEDRRRRLEALLVGNRASLARLRDLADESARFNIGPAERNFNEPTFALRTLTRADTERFAFRRSGDERLDTLSVWKVDYAETRRPTIVRTGPQDAPLHGTLWIDPASGRVHRTDARLRDPSTGGDARITVRFGRDRSLNMWVPVRMDESYRGGAASVNSTATYSGYRRFETSGRLLNP